MYEKQSQQIWNTFKVKVIIIFLHHYMNIYPLLFIKKISILVIAVLGGKVAVSCNSQSALARLNSFSEVEYM